ncbi:MAG: hypothetical protein ACJ77B_08970 [Chloroflexota bacterium]
MRRPLAARGALAALAIALLLAAAGCAPPAPTGTRLLASGTPPAATPAAPSPSRTGAAPPPSVELRPSTAPAAIDPALLDHLPPTVDGFARTRVPESDAIAQNDPLVVGAADAAVTALYTDPANGEFAHATLVHVLPGVFSDAFFRSWRDAFDASVCEPAGGVGGRAEATIAGRKAFIDSCAEGVRTYHIWLERSSVLVSVSSIGGRLLGEKVAAALTD